MPSVTLICHQLASARKLYGLAAKAIFCLAVINVVTI
jgi:hypothetical protein